jgi:hypothetical protein
MPEIKERPILFSAPMVRAILDGRKTVTRRVVKAQPANGWNFDLDYGRISSSHRHKGKFGAFIRRGVGTDFPEIDIVPSPYGMPGDRLWVRETHADIGCRLTYRADTDDGAHCQVKKWTPAIHMFRRHSRILLEITDVRVERLWDIDDEQSLAEGIYSNPEVNGMYTADGDHHTSKRGGARSAFIHLWESTGGDWNGNPWVWVIELKQVTP